MRTGITADKINLNPDSIVNKTPVTCDWFLNDFCNNRCSYCSWVRYMDRASHQIRLPEFKKYADRLKEIGVKGILVTGGGEPTLCQDFDEMMAYLEEINMPYGITTNFNVLKYFRPQFLKISLDCWDDDSYEAKRGVRKYTEVRENIIKYLDWAKDNSPGTSVGLQLVLTSAEEIYKFYDSNKDLDVDFFTFKPVESTRGIWYKDKEHLRDKAELLRAIKHLSKADKRVMFNFKWNYTDVGYDECHGHANQIALNWNGEIQICCHRPYDIIGHIMDEDVLEKNRQTKFDMSRCDIPCRMSSANGIVKYIESHPIGYEFL